jgi:ABC-type transport system involved in cytochrome bd biosynthesis fused ATPase/permease subunit
MNNLLTILAIVLVIAWASAYFAFHVAGALIHVLLVIAIVALVLRMLGGRNSKA